MTGERAKVFRFDEPGSSILRRWNEQRALERRLAARNSRQMRYGAFSTGGFAAASIDRLTAGLNTWSGALNADLDRALVPMRAGARRLAANTGHGRRFLGLVAQNVIGLGPVLQVRARNVNRSLDKPGNDAIETHFATWAKTADVAGRMNLAHLCRVGVKAVARDGETLVRKVRNRKLPYGLALQLLDADRLDETLNQRLDNGNIIRQGVELDSALRPIAYHLRVAHPGEIFDAQPSTRIERVPAGEIIHVFLQERAEQVRGYTWFHAVLRESDMRYGYKEAALVAARVGASKMGVFQRKDEGTAPGLESVADGKGADGALQMNAEPGEFIEAPPGYELASWDPDYPHANFESFVATITRDIAVGLDVAAHNLSGDMSDVNYSSARIAELGERDFWTVLQEWFFSMLLVPIYQDWLASALLMGEITMESGQTLPARRLQKFLDVSRFQGRRWPWVDPFKEASANEKLVAAGLTSRTRICAAQGVEFEDVIDELAAEEAYAKEKGVVLVNPKLAAGDLAKPADAGGAGTPNATGDGPVDPTDAQD